MPATVACPRCGALNGAEFDRCIRCNQALRGAAPAVHATRSAISSRPAPARPAIATGPGSEPLLGRWDADDLPATKFFLGLNAAVFAFHCFLLFHYERTFGSLFTGEAKTEMGQMLLYRFGAMRPDWVEAGEVWRLLSACFVHFGAIHFGMNMLALVHLSRVAEPAIGSVRYALAYVATGIVGFAASLAWSALTPPDPAAVAQGIVLGLTAGASGAIFGLMGLVLGFLWRRRDERWKLWLGQVVLFSLAFTFMLRSINHAAHFGGLLSGVVFGALFAPGAPQPSTRVQRVLAFVAALACIASLVACQVRFRMLMRDAQQPAQSMLQPEKLQPAEGGEARVAAHRHVHQERDSQ
jgi:MYXO-CTERM domain-containing protein